MTDCFIRYRMGLAVYLEQEIFTDAGWLVLCGGKSPAPTEGMKDTGLKFEGEPPLYG